MNYLLQLLIWFWCSLLFTWRVYHISYNLFLFFFIIIFLMIFWIWDETFFSLCDLSCLYLKAVVERFIGLCSFYSYWLRFFCFSLVSFRWYMFLKSRHVLFKLNIRTLVHVNLKAFYFVHYCTYVVPVMRLYTRVMWCIQFLKIRMFCTYILSQQSPFSVLLMRCIVVSRLFCSFFSFYMIAFSFLYLEYWDILSGVRRCDLSM